MVCPCPSPLEDHKRGESECWFDADGGWRGIHERRRLLAEAEAAERAQKPAEDAFWEAFYKGEGPETTATTS